MRQHRAWLHAHCGGVVLMLLAARPLSADVFNMPPGLTGLEFVTVGEPGNAADQRDTDVFSPGVQHAGAVPYVYRIGRYEVTNAQYAEFLTSIYWEQQPYAWGPLASGAIKREVPDRGPPLYFATPGRENSPVTFAYWTDAARFANWLHNGQGNGDTETGAYDLRGDIDFPVLREPDARFFIPSDDEWYKAAFFQPEDQGGPPGDYWKYPTGQNRLLPNENLGGANYFDGDYVATGTAELPDYWVLDPLTEVGHYTGARTFYGTFDQAGNAFEWTDSFLGDLATGRGGGWVTGDYQVSYFYRGAGSPYPSNGLGLGFRIAAIVPEPATVLMLASGALAVLVRRRDG